ncbi:ATP-binding protein [Rubrivivax rivuli]|uniref:Tetratricopeptide repeat protein n=1 Tax=Rubrivivax rivuli TaxID=1862385 RepID=A0A437RCG5_9BURK|nr:tetratricopeptide repeat protein [Rubrivivax rivuli]RVU44374.1 tetratricopeptide repeat protein [Rubrivivax rivuli]
MSTLPALLLTDLVDSAALTQQMGDEAYAQLSARHDRLARDLLRQWHGQEIDKTDGFLFIFQQPADALGYALAYHRALATLPVPMKARAGLHVGQVVMREATPEDVALGAKPVEVDGVSKPIAARVMSTALGGQTLLTQAAIDAIGPTTHRVVSHGHWQVKGLPVPIELFEVGEPDAPFTPPPDSVKVWRVVRHGDKNAGLWLPLRELPHSLPAERDAFVGRRRTLQDLAQRFDAGARLVSLLGIGGGGKTRVATRYGWAWMGEYPGGVWFCDLAPARSIEGIASAVAQGLQVPLGPEDPVVQLGHAIAGRGTCLVILDNFEHLARHAEATLGRWLDRAMDARFLVTTREVLGIPGEETLALAPMQGDDAQALFMRRAEAARRDFKPGPDDAEAIATLVGLLDGLPLAIELAAARTRTLAPRALLARMSERFKLLASSGGRLDRQATLRATFDWSWGLLPTAEKSALAQLSVFEGGFTLEAAEAVIDLSALEDPPWTLDVLQALVDKSFVRTLGQERYDLLGSVQAYAAEHLGTEGRYTGSGPAARLAAEGRHGAWFAGLDNAAASAGRGIELDNLVVACRRAVARADTHQAAGALEGGWAALNLRGPFKAGADLAELVLGMPGLEGREAARAHAVSGMALEAAGQRQAALARYARATELAVAAGDRGCQAMVAIRRAALLARAGQVDTARLDLQQALQLAQEDGDKALKCAALNVLGVLAFEGGAAAEARAHYSAALSLARACGERRVEGAVLGNLGNLEATAGQTQAARAHAEAALEVLRELGDRTREAMTLVNLGMLRFFSGDVGDAANVLQRGLVAARELGHRRLECIALGNLGLVLDGAGRHAEAVERYDAALALAGQLGDRRTEGQFMGHRAVALARSDRFAEAQACIEQATSLLQPQGDPISLGLLAVQRAEVAWRAGRHAEVQPAMDNALALAAAAEAGPESELGKAIARLRETVAG